MSINWVKDMYDMHTKYGMHNAVKNMTDEQLKEFLQFRIKFLQEELTELEIASNDPTNQEEVVDALIDLCVVAIGTLDLFGVNAYKAWDEVLKANMNKEVGIKESRPNPNGLPDLIKPKGWIPPCHEGNHGIIK